MVGRRCHGHTSSSTQPAIAALILRLQCVVFASIIFALGVTAAIAAQLYGAFTARFIMYNYNTRYKSSLYKKRSQLESYLAVNSLLTS